MFQVLCRIFPGALNRIGLGADYPIMRRADAFTDTRELVVIGAAALVALDANNSAPFFRDAICLAEVDERGSGISCCKPLAGQRFDSFPLPASSATTWSICSSAT
jgi:hypothetical protein